MAFDIEKLAAHCAKCVRDFAKDHGDETFYAFTIDASMFCLNSLEQFEKNLKEYQDRWLRNTRPIFSTADMTEEDYQAEKFALDLAERLMGLDRKDEDACLAVINESRTRMRGKGCDWFEEDRIEFHKFNSGDWAYQGFVHVAEEHGFDHELYDDHYNEEMDSEDGHAPETKYAVAMTELVTRLKASDSFAPLKTTPDFLIAWVDHDY